MSAKVACAPEDDDTHGLGATFSPTGCGKASLADRDAEAAPAPAAAGEKAPTSSPSDPAMADWTRRRSSMTIIATLIKAKAKAKALIGLGGLGRERVLAERAKARAKLEAAHPEMAKKCARHDGGEHFYDTPHERARRTLETDPSIIAVLDKWVVSVGKRLPAADMLPLVPTEPPAAAAAAGAAPATDDADVGAGAGAGAKEDADKGKGKGKGKAKSKRKSGAKGKDKSGGTGTKRASVQRQASEECVEGIVITFDMYKKMYVKLHTAFAEGHEEEHGASGTLEGDALDASIRKDWDHDARGGKFLTAALLRKAIFQIADMWVDSVKAHDYVTFLETLHRKTFPKKKKRKKNWWDRMHSDITMNQFLTDQATKLEKAAWKQQRKVRTKGGAEEEHVEHCIVM